MSEQKLCPGSDTVVVPNERKLVKCRHCSAAWGSARGRTAWRVGPHLVDSRLRADNRERLAIEPETQGTSFLRGTGIPTMPLETEIALSDLGVALMTELAGACLAFAKKLRETNAKFGQIHLDGIADPIALTALLRLQGGRLSLTMQLLPDKEDGREEDDDSAAPRGPGGETGTLH